MNADMMTLTFTFLKEEKIKGFNYPDELYAYFYACRIENHKSIYLIYTWGQQLKSKQMMIRKFVNNVNNLFTKLASDHFLNEFKGI